MAKLKAHGVELARRETPFGRIALMSDRNILRNDGQGWKLWRKVKPETDLNAYAVKFKAFTEAMPDSIKAYVEALRDAVDLEHRWKLHTLITLMAQDVDGIKSEFDDYGYQVDYEDLRKACMRYEGIAQDAITEGLKQG